jgi:predicted  nucleic acid-binding Zn-ribbon protein
MKKVQPLVELQHLDSALDRERERLATVRALLADDSTLGPARASCAAAEAELRKWQTEQRDLELEVQDLREKLSLVERKLYGGSVSNAKELENMTRDAAQFRGLISTREDRLLALYDLIDAADQSLATARASLVETERVYTVGQQAFQDEQRELEASIADHEARRRSTEVGADAAALRAYESLRRTRGGLAVAEVTQRTCQGCRVSLPTNEATRARASDELVFCQSCGRILHAVA